LWRRTQFEEWGTTPRFNRLIAERNAIDGGGILLLRRIQAAVWVNMPMPGPCDGEGDWRIVVLHIYDAGALQESTPLADNKMFWITTKNQFSS
jgi:hypothetical protein